jgi:hypothetical protein
MQSVNSIYNFFTFKAHLDIDSQLLFQLTAAATMLNAPAMASKLILRSRAFDIMQE